MIKKIIAVSATLAIASLLCSCNSSSDVSGDNGNAGSEVPQASVESNTNDSAATPSGKIESWDDAKEMAMQVFMENHQTKLDASNLVFNDDNDGTETRGYTVHCYEEYEDHIATIFWYDVDENGTVYDLVLGEYVN